MRLCPKWPKSLSTGGAYCSTWPRGSLLIVRSAPAIVQMLVVTLGRPVLQPPNSRNSGLQRRILKRYRPVSRHRAEVELGRTTSTVCQRALTSPTCRVSSHLKAHLDSQMLHQPKTNSQLIMDIPKASPPIVDTPSTTYTPVPTPPIYPHLHPPRHTPMPNAQPPGPTMGIG